VSQNLLPGHLVLMKIQRHRVSDNFHTIVQGAIRLDVDVTALTIADIQQCLSLLVIFSAVINFKLYAEAAGTIAVEYRLRLIGIFLNGVAAMILVTVTAIGSVLVIRIVRFSVGQQTITVITTTKAATLYFDDMSKTAASKVFDKANDDGSLGKGVAYQIGYLPSDIRMRIEELFKTGDIKTILCTSTLVEGVNLPADNLFITSYKNGRSNMTPVDFRNLIGRVGRIEYNLYGNAILVKADERTNNDKFEELLKKEVPEQKLSLASELKKCKSKRL